MSPNESPDDLLRSMRALGPVPPPRELEQRVRRQAHGELERAAGGGWLAMVTRAWTTVGLPAALTVMVVGYLSWAVSSASALYR